MHNPKSLQGSEMHQLLWDIKIQTNHLILARRPDLVMVNKKENLLNSEKLKECDKYLELARELKKQQWNMTVTELPVVIGTLETIPTRLGKGLIDMEIRGNIDTI